MESESFPQHPGACSSCDKIPTYHLAFLCFDFLLVHSFFFYGKDSQASRQIRPIACLGQAEGHRTRVPRNISGYLRSFADYYFKLWSWQWWRRQYATAAQHQRRVDFSGSQGLSRTEESFPLAAPGPAWRLPSDYWPWLNPWVWPGSKQGWACGIENTLQDSNLLTASPRAAHCAGGWVIIYKRYHFHRLLLSNWPHPDSYCCTRYPGKHKLCQPRRTYLPYCPFHIINYIPTHQLKRCDCSQIPPPIQRFPWISLTFVL